VLRRASRIAAASMITARRVGRRWTSLARPAIESVRVLPPVARTPHFVLHHAATIPVVDQLSTDGAPMQTDSVDNTGRPAILIGLGVVAPKRLARRAATRNLIKRQVRAAADRHVLGAGQWLVRLHRAFDVRAYPSAASDALRAHVRAELDELMRGASGAARR